MMGLFSKPLNKEDKILKLIREQFKDDKSISILELCPGEGNFTQELLDENYSNIQLMDINPERFKLDGVTVHHGDLNKPLPFENESMDMVLIIEGIEHLERQYDFTAECNRVLKRNGVLLLTTPNIICFASRIKFLFTGFYSLCTRPASEIKKDWVTEHIYPLTFWQLRHILHTNGLFIKRIDTDRIRKSSLLGILFYPFSYLITLLNVNNRKEEIEPRHIQTNSEINRQIHSMSIYFGRTQIILAEKRDHDYIK